MGAMRSLPAFVLLARLSSLSLPLRSDGFQVSPPAQCHVGARRGWAPRPLLRRRVVRAEASTSTVIPAAAIDSEATSKVEDSTDFGDGDPFSHPSVSGRWKNTYLRLVDYRSVHGHCRVPRRHDPDPSLGAWVAYQRHLRSRRRRGLPARGNGNKSANPLTDARVAALDALDFTWDLREHAWRERIDALGQYREEKGDCLVPPDHPDRGLFDFVGNQRSQYARYFAGKASTLNPRRVEELRSVGFFEFERTNHTEAWERRYEELARYAEETGHATVPEKYGPNPALGRWVAHQRVRYRESTLGPDQVEALERIGFRWDVRSYSWSAMLERLRAVYDADGNDGRNVTARLHRDGECRDLRTWVRVQRYHRAMRERGEPSPLTDERIEALDAIGFVWTPRRGPKREDGGPTTDDWSKLFEELKDRGIEAGAEGKEHWFAGGRSFEEEDQELKNWEETDLVALWEQGDDEDDW